MAHIAMQALPYWYPPPQPATGHLETLDPGAQPLSATPAVIEYRKLHAGTASIGYQGFDAIIAGTDLALDPAGVPTGGTITGMSIGIATTTLVAGPTWPPSIYPVTIHMPGALFSGLNVPLVDFYDAWLGPGGSPVAAEGLLLAGDDFIEGSTGDDRMWGGAGSDILDGHDGSNDMVCYDLDAAAGGGAGVHVDLAAGYAKDGFGAGDLLTAIESVRATNAADLLYGTDESNTFQALGGADFIDGRGGIDTADYSYDTGAGVTVDLGAGTAIAGSGSLDILTSIENAIGSDNAHPDFAGSSDLLIGSTGANVLDGRGGNDIILARDGDDTLVGGDGDDFLNGEDGTDTVDYYTSPLMTDGVAVDLGAGTATDGHGDHDILVSIENIIGTDSGPLMFLGTYADMLIGSSVANRIEARDGSDYVDGGAGNDTIWGGLGADMLIGGEGDDTIFGDRPGGTETFYSNTLIGGAGNDTMTGSNSGDTYVFDFGEGAPGEIDTVLDWLPGGGQFRFSASVAGQVTFQDGAIRVDAMGYRLEVAGAAAQDLIDATYFV
ncbi:MAG: calcium-binding protein [Acetobacteraceae bacterium]